MKFLRFLVAAIVVAIVASFQPRSNVQMKSDMPSLKKLVTGAVAGVLATGFLNMPAQALTKSELSSLSYLQIKGTGLANRCPDVVSGAKNTIDISPGQKYKFVDLCIEPTSWQVEEETTGKKGEVKKEFVNTKLMTRQTYSLEGISGSLEVKDGKAVFTEEDGIDYAPTTVQLPGGERVPFLYSIKNLVAKGNTAGPIKDGFEFGGSYKVPSYRTGAFLDPKGRGMTSGYDFAQALPGLQSDKTGVETDRFYEENNKKFDVLVGDAEFAVKAVDAENGEFGGVYVATQPSDTDMGGKVPKNLLIKGKFYGRIE